MPARYPGLELTSILTAAGTSVTPTMANLCLFGDNLKLHALARPLLGGYLRSDPSSTPPWSTMLAEKHAGTATFRVAGFRRTGRCGHSCRAVSDAGIRRGSMSERCPNHLAGVCH